MGKCLLVGIEKNDWTDRNSGELIRSSILYVVHDKPSRPVSELRGQRVEAIKVRFDCNDLQVGQKYDLVYEAVRFGSKSYAQLSDLIPLP